MLSTRLANPLAFFFRPSQSACVVTDLHTATIDPTWEHRVWHLGFHLFAKLVHDTTNKKLQRSGDHVLSGGKPLNRRPLNFSVMQAIQARWLAL